MKYGSYLEERLGAERISITSMDFIDAASSPFYFFGTESGKVVGIPLVFSDDRESFDVLIFDFDPGHAVTFLEFRRGSLIVSTDSSATAVLAIAESEHLFFKTAGGGGVQAAAASTSKVNFIDISPAVRFRETFAAPVKTTMKMKVLQSIRKDLETTATLGIGEILKEAEKYIKQTVCLILENNAVIVYSTKSNSAEFKLNSNKGSIYGLYFNPQADYFVTLTGEGYVHFWYDRRQGYKHC